MQIIIAISTHTHRHRDRQGPPVNVHNKYNQSCDCSSERTRDYIAVDERPTERPPLFFSFLATTMRLTTRCSPPVRPSVGISSLVRSPNHPLITRPCGQAHRAARCALCELGGGETWSPILGAYFTIFQIENRIDASKQCREARTDSIRIIHYACFIPPSGSLTPCAELREREGESE